MEKVKISLIIPVYKKIDFLDRVLDSIKHQVYKNFEVIITEDDNSLKVKEYLNKKIKSLNYKLIHKSQEDLGYRRNTALNKGVLVSSGELIVVIDGDCMIHKKFLYEYAKNFSKGDLFTGRRVDLGKLFSEKIIKQKKSRINLLELLLSDSRKKKIICGVYFPWLNIKRNSRILGSNFGITKKILLKINGFDENYIGYGLEDVDLEKRVLFAGGTLVSMKQKAIQYHLFHPEPQGDTSLYEYNRKLLEKTVKNQKWFCENGINKYTN